MPLATFATSLAALTWKQHQHAAVLESDSCRLLGKKILRRCDLFEEIRTFCTFAVAGFSFESWTRFVKALRCGFRIDDDNHSISEGVKGLLAR